MGLAACRYDRSIVVWVKDPSDKPAVGWQTMVRFPDGRVLVGGVTDQDGLAFLPYEPVAEGFPEPVYYQVFAGLEFQWLTGWMQIPSTRWDC